MNGYQSRENRVGDRVKPLPRKLKWATLGGTVLVLGFTFWSGDESLSQKPSVSSSVAGSDRVEPLGPHFNASTIAARPIPGSSVADLSDKDRVKFVRSAFLLIWAMQDPTEKQAALARFKKNLSPAMMEALLDDMCSEHIQSDAFRMLFDHWASANPAAAAEWAQAEADPQARLDLLALTALRWAATDSNEAAEWARSFPLGQARVRIMEAVGYEAVRTDPLEALIIGLELTAGGSDQNNLIARAAAEWAFMDPKGAIEWIGTIEDADLRQRMAEQVAVASADKDPLAAATLAVERMAPGVAHDRAIVSIVANWVQKDPASAAAWVRKFAEGPLGRDAADNLINLWASRDLVASGNWLLKLESGQMQAAGFDAYMRVLARTHMELARQLGVPTNGSP